MARIAPPQMRRWATVSAVVLLSIVSSVAPAAGETTAELAKARMALGTKAFKAERYRDALDEFLKVEQYGTVTKGQARLLFNIGSCYRKLGDLVQAAHYYQRAQGLAQKPAHRARIQKRIDELEPLAFGSLKVECDFGEGREVEAKVGYDAVATEDCPAKWARVPIGKHAIEGKTSHGLVSKGEVTVEGSKETVVSLPFPGGVVLPFRARNAIVLVDGLARGGAPARITDLSPGSHDVAVRVPGYPESKLTVVVKGGVFLELPADRFPGLNAALTRSHPHLGWVWTSLGLGIAALATGLYYSVEGSTGETLWNADYPDGQVPVKRREQAEADRDTWVADQNAGRILLASGGVLVTAGAAIYLLAGNAGGANLAGVRVGPTAGGMAVSWQATW